MFGLGVMEIVVIGIVFALVGGAVAVIMIAKSSAGNDRRN